MSIVLQGLPSRTCSCPSPSAATACASIQHPLRPSVGSGHHEPHTGTASWRVGSPLSPHLLAPSLGRWGTARVGSQLPCQPAAMSPAKSSPPAVLSLSAQRRAAQGMRSQSGVAISLSGGRSRSSSSCCSGFPAWSRPGAQLTGRTRGVVLGPAGSAAASPDVSDSGASAASEGGAAPAMASAGPSTRSGPSGAPAAAVAAGDETLLPEQQGQQQPTTSLNGHPGAEAAGPSEQQQQSGKQATSPYEVVATEAGSVQSPESASSSASAVPDRNPADDVATDALPSATLVDGLPETQKHVLADEWGFSHVGADLPDGTSPATFSDMFPDSFFTFDGRRAALALAVPLAAMAAGYGWLWYWHSICPLWQQLTAGALIGTAYTGLFKVAHECSRFAFLPQYPGLQEILGVVLMLPSLYPFPCWRLGFLDHMLHLNQLGRDRFGWHPYTKLQLMLNVLAEDKVALALRRLVLATPLKLLGSIGHWLRTFEGLDLTRFHPTTYNGILWGWALPLLFAGFAIPAMIAAGGLSGFFSCYLFPWLVFHFWLSTLSLLQHTAPHIPWRLQSQGYDPGQATICGTVTVRLPRPLEVLLNDANYNLPLLVAPGLPMYNAREAYDYMRERLLPYLTEAPLSLKLLTNHITKWQVYDEIAETYRPMEDVEEEVLGEIRRVEDEALAELRAAQEQQQQEQKADVSQGPEPQEQGPGPGLATA